MSKQLLMLRYCRVATVALLILPFLAADALACCGESGEPVRPCTPYWTSDAVFVGEVVTVVQREADPHVDENWSGTRDVHVRVVEAFRGITEHSVVFREPAGTSTNVEWGPGKRYFVYASADLDTGLLRTSNCTTRPLPEAQRDLEYARWVTLNPKAGRIVVDVYHEQWDAARDESFQYPFPHGVEVELVGAGGPVSVAPSIKGSFGTYVFEVPPGKYELKVRAPSPLVADETGSLPLDTAGGCLAASVRLRWSGVLRGRLVDAHGRPVPHASLTLMAHRSPHPREYRWEEFLATDEHGEFSHPYLGPGDYILGVHTDRDARGRREAAFFYPGTADRTLARVISMELGSELDIGDFILPARVDKVPVEGVVLNADGSPAADAAVRLHSDEHTFDMSEMLTRTDANGRFRIFGVAGGRYVVSAYGSGPDANTAGEATVVAGPQAGLVIRLQSAAGQE